MKEWLAPMLIGIVMFVLGGAPKVSPPDDVDPDRQEVIDDSWDDSGSGFEDSAGEPSPSTPAVITMLTQPNCPPCEQWWRVERPKWEAVGWTVEKADVSGSGFRSTPSFLINDRNGDSYRVAGYLTVSAAQALMSQSTADNGIPLVNGPHQIPGEYGFDGGVSDHLMGENHLLSPGQLAGKSQADLEQMHSIDHRLYGPVPARARSPSTAAGCPTGSCSTSTRSNRVATRGTGPVREWVRKRRQR